MIQRGQQCRGASLHGGFLFGCRKGLLSFLFHPFLLCPPWHGRPTGSSSSSTPSVSPHTIWRGMDGRTAGALGF